MKKDKYAKLRQIIPLVFMVSFLNACGDSAHDGGYAVPKTYKFNGPGDNYQRLRTDVPAVSNWDEFFTPGQTQYRLHQVIALFLPRDFSQRIETLKQGFDLPAVTQLSNGDFDFSSLPTPEAVFEPKRFRDNFYQTPFVPYMITKESSGSHRLLGKVSSQYKNRAGGPSQPSIAAYNKTVTLFGKPYYERDFLELRSLQARALSGEINYDIVATYLSRLSPTEIEVRFDLIMDDENDVDIIARYKLEK